MKFEEVKNNKEIMSQLRWDLTPQTATVYDAYITKKEDLDKINQILAEKAGYFFFVNVWNCQAKLSLMHNHANGNGTMYCIEDFQSPLLEKAVEQADGAISRSGWYPLSKQLIALLKKKLFG